MRGCRRQPAAEPDPRSRFLAEKNNRTRLWQRWTRALAGTYESLNPDQKVVTWLVLVRS